jgi:hypothetical protein
MRELVRVLFQNNYEKHSLKLRCEQFHQYQHKTNNYLFLKIIELKTDHDENPNPGVG